MTSVYEPPPYLDTRSQPSKTITPDYGPEYNQAPYEYTSPATPDISDWRNLSISEMLKTWTPAQLAMLPVEALVQFSNQDLQNIINANPSILGDIPADRLVQFSGEALNLFLQNLQARGDYASNPKIQAQYQNLYNFMQQQGGLAPVLRPPVIPPPPAAPAPPPGGAGYVPPAPTEPLTGREPIYGGGLAVPQLATPTMPANFLSLSPQEQYLYLSGAAKPGTLAPPPRTAGGGQIIGEPGMARTMGGGTQLVEDPPGSGNYIEVPVEEVPVEEPGTTPPGTFTPPPGGQTPGTFTPSPGGPAGSTARPETAAEANELNARADYYRAQAEKERRAAEEAAKARDFEGQQAALNRAAQMDQLKMQMEQKAAELTSQRQLAERRAGVEESQLRGYFPGGQTTLEREVATSEAYRRNAELLMNRANQAAQIALAQGNQAEARRQFDIAQKLQREIQTGQLSLATRAQIESETQGAFGRNLQTAQFERERLMSPGGFLGEVYGARGLSPAQMGAAPQNWGMAGGPAGTGGAPAGMNTIYGSQGGALQAPWSASQAPLSAGEILRSPATPLGIREAFTGGQSRPFSSSFPLISPQRLNEMTGTERSALGAAVQATGTNQEDYFNQSLRGGYLPTAPRTIRAPDTVSAYSGRVV